MFALSCAAASRPQPRLPAPSACAPGWFTKEVAHLRAACFPDLGLQARALLTALALCLCVPVASAQERIALVIGNGAYGGAMGRLANPVNDAQLMSRTLEQVGFAVTVRMDADRKAMNEAINTFGRRLAQAGQDAVGLFFYAGHGAQANGDNYLIPLGVSVGDEYELQTNGVHAQWVLDRMEDAGNDLNIVVLDACRNLPFRAGSRSLTRGLAQMRGPSGSLIAYSTAPDSVAEDGAGLHSPYAQALSRAVLEPGIRLDDVFRRVGEAVEKATNSRQTPWKSDSLKGAPFYFQPSGEPPAPIAQLPAGELAKPPPGIQAARPAASTFEIEVFDRVMYAAKRANVRGGPGVSYAAVAQLRVGQEIAVTGAVVGSNWMRVEADGQRGFVHGPLLVDQWQEAATAPRGRPRESAATRWRSIAEGGPWDMEKFLADYPGSEFADAARKRAETALCRDSYVAKSYLGQYADGLFAEAARTCLLTFIEGNQSPEVLESYTEPFGAGTELLVDAARRRIALLRSWEAVRGSDDAFALEGLLAQIKDPELGGLASERIVDLVATMVDADLLRRYLREYPEGAGAHAAERRLVALETWIQIERSDDPSMFERFLSQTSDAVLANRARERVLDLINDADVQALQRYLRDHPQGAGAQAAGYRLAVLKQGREEQQRAHRTFRDCPKCPQMVVIPAGRFMMGSPTFETGRRKDEGPQREVVIKKVFALSIHEITFDDWDACLAAGRCNGWNPHSEWGRGRMPVVNVSRFDAEAYIAWLNRDIGASGYRLPSEAEWEYAARANSMAPFSFGASASPLQANFNARGVGFTGDRDTLYRRKTTEVGSFPRNTFDLHDTHGNVAEWVSDCWHDTYEGAPNTGASWGTPPCRYGLVRGGSWKARLSELRLSKRQKVALGERTDSVGFRVARDLP